MSSSHPAQAGKFRPVKPKPKPIAPPPGTTISSSTHPQQQEQDGNNYKNRSMIGNSNTTDYNGGGGGGGGRKPSSFGNSSHKPPYNKNRFVIPKGEVFFTAGAAASNNHNDRKKASSSFSSSSMNPSSFVGSQQRMSGTGTGMGGRSTKNIVRNSNEGEEIIVGTVDDGQGVGDSKNIFSSTRSKKDNNAYAMDDDYISGSNNNSNVKLDNHLYTFDSSSSTDNEEDEEEEEEKGSDLYSQPLSVKSNALVHGSFKKSQVQKPMSDNGLQCMNTNTTTTTLQELNPTSQEWILFKFPTRLPTFETQQSSASNQNIHPFNLDNSNTMTPLPVLSSSTTATITPNNEEIVIADDQQHLIQSSSDLLLGSNTTMNKKSTMFDDSFKDCKAGRYGKIIIHKSGKAYFRVYDNGSNSNDTINGDTNVSSVQMSFMNGLTCHFLQQAVSIDLEQGKYIPMGQVKKSFTITPEL